MANIQRFMRVLLIYPAMAAVIIAGCIAMLFVFGMVIEHITEVSERLDRCEQQAETPYEYHQCPSPLAPEAH